MELHHLRCFVAVAEEGSFTRAAAQLHFAPSNVTQHVQHLERELGVKVLERGPRWVGLTPAGALLLDAARQVLDDVTALRGLARQAALGLLGAMQLSYCPGSGHLLAPLVRAVGDAHPDVSLLSSQRTTADVADDVAAGRASVGISRMTGPTLDSLVLCEERSAFLVLPDGHPLAERDRLVLGDLEGQPVIVVAEETQRLFHRQSVDFYAARGVHPGFRPFPLTTVEECIDLVAAGNGIILMPWSSIEQYHRHGVVVRPVDGDVPTVVHRLLWRRNDDSPVVAAVVALARNLLPAFAADYGGGAVPSSAWSSVSTR